MCEKIIPGRMNPNPKLELCLMDICIICNTSKSGLKDLHKDTVQPGKFVNHMNALFDCFNIRLYDMKYDIKNSKICISCIHQLQNAFSFRKVVLAAQEKIQRNIDMLISKRNQSKTLNSKPPSNVAAKISKRIDNKIKLNKSSKNDRHEDDSNKTLKQLKDEMKSLDKSEPPYKIEYNITRDIFNELNDSSKTLNESEVKIKIEPLSLDDPNDNLMDSGVEIKIEFETSDNSTLLHNTEDINTAEDLFNNYSSDSSTTSEQMRIATRRRAVRKDIHPTPSLNTSCRTCPLCDKTYMTFKNLKAHYYSHIDINYLCDFCGLTYVHKQSFDLHMKIHYGIKYPCEQCEKIYTNSSNLKMHIRACHNKERIYKCPECDKTYTSSVSKRIHLYREHNIKGVTFPCTVCEKVFFSKTHLRCHVQTTHDTAREFPCQECGKIFPYEINLKRHMVTHKGIKNVICPVCGKAFARKRSLREHTKIHDNIRDYSCDLCGRTFIQKTSLNSHMNTHMKNSQKQTESHSTINE